ncbi:CU044_2847 family protein [Kitasatospora sp. NPDC048540]|uniref:CU044_2847 family protein n=1 Tax=unclassified Kitasatospora TaxID=2633591 RepID=UPI00053B660D|nr:CU044_2847 family protein [Kitasatospora sp. MBT63]
MPDCIEFLTDEGAVVRVETAAADGHPDSYGAPYGMEPVGRGVDGQVRHARAGFEQALDGVRAAAAAALAVFRDGTLRPDGVEIEFGVKLTAEAGALIARTGGEAHLTVRLSWGGDRPGSPDRP